MNKLSERLANLRKNKGLTLREQSEELDDIKPVTLSRYEHKRREPNIETLLKLASYFNCSTDYLIGRVEYMNLEELVELNNIDPERAGNMIDLYNATECLKSDNIRKEEFINVIDILKN